MSSIGSSRNSVRDEESEAVAAADSKIRHHSPNSFRNKHFTVPLGKIRRAFKHGGGAKEKDSNHFCSTSVYNQSTIESSKSSRVLQPPELTLNDSKMNLSPVNSREPHAKESRLKLGSRGKEKNTLSPNFLSVYGGAAGSETERQRPRAWSINFDGTTPIFQRGSLNNSCSQLQNLHPVLGTTKSVDAKSYDQIRAFLESGKASPFRKLFFSTLLNAHKCEVLVPSVSKVIVLDSRLTISKAFSALVYNHLRAAPVWNSRRMNFESMMTVTDFIHVLLDRHQMAIDVDFLKFSKIQIGFCTKIDRAGKLPLIYAFSNSTLYDCLQLLLTHRIHRLPIFDNEHGNILCFASHRQILRFIHLSSFHKPLFYNQPVENLKIGTYGRDKIKSVPCDMVTWQVLKLFRKSDLSVLPVVDENYKFLGLYSKEDVFYLGARERSQDFLLPVSYWLNKFSRNRYKRCKSTDKLSTIIASFCENDVRHLIITRDNELHGLISISDVNKFILANQRQDSDDQSESPTASSGNNSLRVSVSSLNL